jgi:predicted Zn-ribbon and HTH transcriptional regulator
MGGIELIYKYVFTTITTRKMKCTYCKYEWEPRKEKPKACPRCKRRFDYPTAMEVNK